MKGIANLFLEFLWWQTFIDNSKSVVVQCAFSYWSSLLQIFFWQSTSTLSLWQAWAPPPPYLLRWIQPLYFSVFARAPIGSFSVWAPGIARASIAPRLCVLGRRKCPAEAVGKVTVPLFFISVLQWYTLKFAPNTHPDPYGEQYGVYVPASYEVILEKRH